jgi:hypothetical protein
MLAKVTEITSGTAYYTEDGRTSLTATGHMLELRFSVGALSGSGSGSSSSSSSSTSTASVLEKVTSSSSSGSGTGTGSGSGTGYSDYTTCTYSIGIVCTDDIGDFIIPPVALTISADGNKPIPSKSVPISQTGTGWGMTETLSAGDNTGVEIMANPADPTGTIPATAFTVYAEVDSTLHHWNGSAWVLTTTVNHQVVCYDLEKLLAQAWGPVDSRRCYGDPDRDGSLIADPNAAPRYPQFMNWLYQGGLFVGNMAYSTGDQSSTGRTQFDFPPATGDDQTKLRASALSCYYTQCPSNATGSLTVGVYLPLLGGVAPYSWPSPTQTTWVVAPRATASSPPNYADDPVDTVSLTSSSTAGYCTWSLMQIATSGTQLVATFEGLQEFYVLCVADEPDFVSAGDTAWRYFSSPSYQALFPTTPLLADSQPRIWNVYAISTATWTTTG